MRFDRRILAAATAALLATFLAATPNPAHAATTTKTAAAAATATASTSHPANAEKSGGGRVGGGLADLGAAGGALAALSGGAGDLAALSGGAGDLAATATGSAAPRGQTVAFDQYSMIIGGKRTFIWSGEMHPFRLPSPELWRDVLQKMKSAGFNAVSFYFDWGYHSPAPGVYDFHGVRDMDLALRIADEVG